VEGRPRKVLGLPVYPLLSFALCSRTAMHTHKHIKHTHTHTHTLARAHTHTSTQGGKQTKKELRKTGNARRRNINRLGMRAVTWAYTCYMDTRDMTQVTWTHVTWTHVTWTHVTWAYTPNPHPKARNAEQESSQEGKDFNATRTPTQNPNPRLYTCNDTLRHLQRHLQRHITTLATPLATTLASVKTQATTVLLFTLATTV
jgi:hypothetical protein